MMFILSVLEACAVMAVRDCIGTFLTVAEAKGKDWMSGALDALSDLMGLLFLYFGLDIAMPNGHLTGHGAIIIGAMMVTSFFGTTLWTRIGRKLK